MFGYDRTLIKSIKDSGIRSMSDVISYANNMVVDKPIDHIRVSNEAGGWCIILFSHVVRIHSIH